MEKEEPVCYRHFFVDGRSSEDKKFYKDFCSKCKLLTGCKEETKIRENEEKLGNEDISP